jgi:hypothetical protein
MAIFNVGRQRALLLAGALVITAWGSVGLYLGLNSGFSGGLYDPEYRVPAVRRGGLADKSGFKAGDRVISVEGRPVEELGMESRWPRSLVPRIGESRRFVVERNGERIPIDVAFPAPFAGAVNNRIKAALAGLAFLGFGLWAFLTVQTRPARTLAHIGLAAGAGAALGLGPHLGSWNGVQSHISTAAGVLMFILLLRFFVTFPTPKPVSESRTAAWLVYGAWGCLVAFLAAELIVHPTLYYTTGSVVSPLQLACGILIFAAITHTVVRTPRAELRASGMYLILAGLLTSIAVTVTSIASELNLPGWTDALVIAAIPLTMTLAVRRQARLDEGRANACGAAP